MRGVQRLRPVLGVPFWDLSVEPMKENVTDYSRNPCSLNRERDAVFAAKLFTLSTGTILTSKTFVSLQFLFFSTLLVIHACKMETKAW